MAVTLAQAKVGMADKVDQQIIDGFRRESLLLDALTFDDSISPGTGGSTLTYGYIQLKTPSTAAVRTINSEYTAGEAEREEKTAKAIVMGGSFEIDRVIQNTSGAVDELAFQVDQKTKATANYFHNLVINGSKTSPDSGFVAGTFDGLRKLLASTSNEFTSEVDISTSAKLDSNYTAFLDEVDAFVSSIDGKADMLLMNHDMLVKMRGAARRAGYYAKERDEFGRQVEYYNDIPMMDMGKYYNGVSTVDVIETTTPDTTNFGTTAIYAVSIGLDGLHGISPEGSNIITSYLPDLTAPGAVKKGEVELVAGIVLKNTLKAAVLKGIAIKPKSGE